MVVLELGGTVAERFDFPGPAKGPWPGEDEEASVSKKRGFLASIFEGGLSFVPGFDDDDEEEASGATSEAKGGSGGGGGSGGNGGGGAGGAAPVGPAGGAVVPAGGAPAP